MKNKSVVLILGLVFLIGIGEMVRRSLSPSPTVVQSSEKIQQSRFEADQSNSPRNSIRDSGLIEEFQEADRAAEPLAVPRWVETSSWNYTPQRRDFGLKKARAPQYVWLDWFDVSGATHYEIYVAYSKVAFKKGNEKYSLLITTKKTEYHSGDPMYLIGSRRLFQKTGYYRFKVTAIDDYKEESPASKYLELILNRKFALVAPGLSFNQKHS